MLHSRILGLSLAAAALIACNDNSTQPSLARIEGTYAATAFTVVTPDTMFDLLAEGVTLTITLNRDGTMTGSQRVDTTVTDLSGQWDTSAATLHLHPTMPGLLTLTPFTISPDRLQGDPLINQFAFHLTLTKQRTM
ncbi:MAG TPA: hypothetical protein VJN95_00405 [Gemmatimonadales bacterium]|nr:hypothetical protein [Gemmatimonadales bacterium]